MKKMLIAIMAGVLACGSGFAQTNWGRTVMYDSRTYKFLEPKIVQSNDLATTGGAVNAAGLTNKTAVPVTDFGPGDKTLEFVHSAGASISGAVAIVRGDKLIAYWSDGVWRQMPANTLWTGGLGSVEPVWYIDWQGWHINSNIMCTVSGRWDIGSADMPLRALYADDVHVSGSSIYMGGVKVFSYDPTTTQVQANVAISQINTNGSTNVTVTVIGVASNGQILAWNSSSNGWVPYTASTYSQTTQVYCAVSGYSEISGVASNATNATYLTTPVSTGVLYVDGGRTDVYVENGTITRPYKTIAAAESNANNVTTIWLIRKSAHYNEPNLVISNACNLRGQGEPIIDGPVIFKGHTKTVSSIQFVGNVICSNLFVTFSGGEIAGTVYVGSTNASHAVRLDGTYVHSASGPAIVLSGAAGISVFNANCTAVGDMTSSALSCTGTGLVSIVNSLAMNMATAPTISLSGGQLVGSQNLIYNLGYGVPFYGSAISATNALVTAPNVLSDVTCMGGLIFDNSLTVIEGAILTIPGTTISGTLVNYRPASRLSNDSVVNSGVGTVKDALNNLYSNKVQVVGNPTNNQVIAWNAAGSQWNPTNQSGSTLGKWTVVVSTTNLNVLVGDVAKTFVMRPTANLTNYLPSVAFGDIGTWYTFVKNGTNRLTIKAADADIIADSSAGARLYNSATNEYYATVTLQLANGTNWVITGAHGTWTSTTD